MVTPEKSISKYLHLHKISHFEKTSQRDYYIWNWGNHAKSHLIHTQPFIY